MENKKSLYTRSFSLLFNRSLRAVFSDARISFLLKGKKNSYIIGWGYKASTDSARAISNKYQLPYWALEDGFVSWLNHPSLSKSYQRLSYIVDTTGIYYDASQPSGLDVVLIEQTRINNDRINRLREQLLKLKISKYNQIRCKPEAYPSWLIDLNDKGLKYLLLIDQTFGDASIEFSGGSENSFQRMLAWAVERLDKDVQLHVVIKIHPDVLLGKKSGYLFETLNTNKLDSTVINRIHFLSEDIAPADLIAMSCEVVTVSSQMGFEALWQNKIVTCFAWPFYAGRGLTQDQCEQPLSYQRKQVSLNELLQAALIDYSIYLYPDTQQLCEIEEIIDYLQAHFLTREIQCENLAIPNVSLWKRSFIPEFVSVSTLDLRFGKSKNNDVSLLWGMKNASGLVDIDSHLCGSDGALGGESNVNSHLCESDHTLRNESNVNPYLRGSDGELENNVAAGSNLVEEQNASSIPSYPRRRVSTTLDSINSIDVQKKKKTWRIEDGFIRSVGLGADLRRPSSLVLDDLGIYYNGKQASRLEHLLENYTLNSYEQHRATKLLTLLRETKITKYNVEGSSDVAYLHQKAADKKRVLVTGQFQQDLSMEFGAENIRDNLSLLQQVRKDYPDAFIIYKEHPDVYSGVRPGRLDEKSVYQYADAYVSDTSLTDLFHITDKLCTICSLAGFEALTRGISVTTYGLPFYAGWGLTQDQCVFSRRTKLRTVEELVYITLILYARYVNWGTRQITTVESTINTLVCDRPQNMQLKTSWIARQSRKIAYLTQALFKTHRASVFRPRSRS